MSKALSRIVVMALAIALAVITYASGEVSSLKAEQRSLAEESRPSFSENRESGGSEFTVSAIRQQPEHNERLQVVSDTPQTYVRLHLRQNQDALAAAQFLWGHIRRDFLKVVASSQYYTNQRIQLNSTLPRVVAQKRYDDLVNRDWARFHQDQGRFTIFGGGPLTELLEPDATFVVTDVLSVQSRWTGTTFNKVFVKISFPRRQWGGLRSTYVQVPTKGSQVIAGADSSDMAEKVERIEDLDEYWSPAPEEVALDDSSSSRIFEWTDSEDGSDVQVTINGAFIRVRTAFTESLWLIDEIRGMGQGYTPFRFINITMEGDIDEMVMFHYRSDDQELFREMWDALRGTLTWQ